MAGTIKRNVNKYTTMREILEALVGMRVDVYNLPESEEGELSVIVTPFKDDIEKAGFASISSSTRITLRRRSTK